MIDKILNIKWNEDGTFDILTSQYNIKGCYYQDISFPDLSDQPDAKVMQLQLVYREKVEDSNMRDW